MKGFIKIKRYLVSFCAPKGVRAREVYYIKRAYRRTEKEIDRIYSQSFCCCHYCTYPELYDLEDKQDRRKKLIDRMDVK